MQSSFSIAVIFGVRFLSHSHHLSRWLRRRHGSDIEWSNGGTRTSSAFCNFRRLIWTWNSCSWEH